MNYPASHYALLSALLAIAAASDVARHRISNRVTVVVAVAGVSCQALAHGVVGLTTAFASAAILGALLWPAWSRHMLGGGDLKLASAAAAWLEVRSIPVYLLAASIAAGAMACVAYLASSLRARSEMRSNLVALARGTSIPSVSLGAERGRVVVPAGAAFAVGALVALALGGTP